MSVALSHEEPISHIIGRFEELRSKESNARRARIAKKALSGLCIFSGHDHSRAHWELSRCEPITSGSGLLFNLLEM